MKTEAPNVWLKYWLLLSCKEISPEFSCFSSIWLSYSASFMWLSQADQRIIGATLREHKWQTLGPLNRRLVVWGIQGTAGGDTQGWGTSALPWWELMMSALCYPVTSLPFLKVGDISITNRANMPAEEHSPSVREELPSQINLIFLSCDPQRWRAKVLYWITQKIEIIQNIICSIALHCHFLECIKHLISARHGLSFH